MNTGRTGSLFNLNTLGAGKGNFYLRKKIINYFFVKLKHAHSDRAQLYIWTQLTLTFSISFFCILFPHEYKKNVLCQVKKTLYPLGKFTNEKIITH